LAQKKTFFQKLLNSGEVLGGQVTEPREAFTVLDADPGYTFPKARYRESFVSRIYQPFD